MEPNQNEEKPTIITPEQEEEILPAKEEGRSIPVEKLVAQKTEEVPTKVAELKPGEKVEKKKKKSSALLIGLSVCFVLSIFGIGFGVWTVMRMDTIEAQLIDKMHDLKKEYVEVEPDNNDYRETGNWYGKPSSADRMHSIFITYNNGQDYIDIFDDSIQYFTYDEFGNSFDGSSRSIDKDTGEIMKYVFDNDLNYLTEYENDENADWSIQVNGPGTSCCLYGNGEYPDWFSALLSKLDVDIYGFLHDKK